MLILWESDSHETKGIRILGETPQPPNQKGIVVHSKINNT